MRLRDNLRDGNTKIDINSKPNETENVRTVLLVYDSISENPDTTTPSNKQDFTTNPAK